MATALPPTPPSSSPASGVVEIKVAHLGLIGALVAALITAIISSAGAGYFAQINTAKQLAGETQKSRAEFLRGQQQVLYSAMASHHSKLVVEEEALLDHQNRISGKEAERINLQSDKPADVAFANFAADTSSVQIIASEDVRLIFLELLKEHRSQKVTLSNHASARRNPYDEQAHRDEGFAEEEYIETWENIFQLEQRLFDAARKDMGVK